MKKLLTISLLFVAATAMVIGCEDKKDDDKELLTLMVLVRNALPPTRAIGDPQDVAAASSAAFATSSAMSQVTMAGNPGTGMMQSVMVDADNPAVKEGLKKSILDAVNANAMEKMKDVYASCSGSETVNVDLTETITGTNYTITPDVHVTGTFNCHASTDLSGSFDVSITITGSVTAQFTNMSVQVFDVQNYIDNDTFEFDTVSVNGEVSLSNVDVTTKVSFDYSVLPLSLRLNVKNLSGVHLVSDLQIDGSDQTIDLNAAEEFNFKLSLVDISGSISAIVEGTVNGNDVSVSYGFRGDAIFEFQDYVTSHIGYGLY